MRKLTWTIGHGPLRPTAALMAALMAAACALPLCPPQATAKPVAADSGCPPPGASWASQSPFATHYLTVRGQPYTIAANENDYGMAQMSQLTWVDPAGAWGVCADQPGVGWPYPEQKLKFAYPQPLASLTTLTTSYSQQLPSAGRFDSAYDLWLNGAPEATDSVELMIWTDNNGEETGNTPAGTIRIDGVSYELSVDPQLKRIDLVLPQGRRSGAVNLLHVLKALQADRRSGAVIGARPALTEIDYGFEIFSTTGTEAFVMNSYTVTLARKPRLRRQWLPRRAASLRQPL
jgi:Glycosyl hydrolase family 12